MDNPHYTFEDKIDVIDGEIAKRRSRWHLSAFAGIDFDDVSQLLRLHIYKKWHLYDQSKPLLNWVNTVITRHTFNLIRNNWGNIAPPCNGCKFDEGDNRCGYTVSSERDSSCKLYANWLKKKKDAYQIKLASSIDDPDYVEGWNQPIDGEPSEVDYEKSANLLHAKMREKLNDYQWKIYSLLYIEGEKDSAVAEIMGYTTTEANRSPGYKQLHNIKKLLLTKVKKVMEEEDIITG